MKFKFTAFALSSIAVLMSATVFAGGPVPVPQTRMMNSGFSFGIQGGAGIGVAQHQGTYIFQTATTPFDDTASSLEGLLGAKLGYQWAVTNHYTLGLQFGFNYFFGKNEQDWHIDDQSASTTSGLNLKNQLSPREQYNLSINEELALTPSFNLIFEGGFSTINAQYKMTPSASSSTETVGSASTQTKFLFGGMVGSGLQYTFSKHMSVDMNMDVYMYAPRNFNTLNNVGKEGQTDQLKNRKIMLILPTISIGYTYHF